MTRCSSRRCFSYKTLWVSCQSLYQSQAGEHLKRRAHTLLRGGLSPPLNLFLPEWKFVAIAAESDPSRASSKPLNQKKEKKPNSFHSMCQTQHNWVNVDFVSRPPNGLSSIPKPTAIPRQGQGRPGQPCWALGQAPCLQNKYSSIGREWRQLGTHLLPDVVPVWGEWQEPLPCPRHWKEISFVITLH